MTAHDAARRAAAAVDQERLWRRHMAMAEIGKIPGGRRSAGRRCRATMCAPARCFWSGPRRAATSFRSTPSQICSCAGPGRRRTRRRCSPARTWTASRPAGGSMGSSACSPRPKAARRSTMPGSRRRGRSSWSPGPTRRADGSRPAPTGGVRRPRRAEDCLQIADAAGVLFRDALAATLAATPEVPRHIGFGFPRRRRVLRAAHRAGAASRGERPPDRRGHRHSGGTLVRGRGGRRARPRRHYAAAAAARTRCAPRSRSSARCRS